MLVRKFKWQEDPDHGEFGWMPAWMEGANVVSDFGLAHDVLEHFPRCMGGFEGEMMAFGAILYIRGQTDWFNSGYYPGWAENVYSEVMNCWRTGVMWGEETCKPCPFNVRLDPRLSSQIKSAVKLARAALLKEEGREVVRRRLPADFARNTERWMRWGYRKAARRFARAGLSPSEAVMLFEEVRTQANRVKHGDEGDQLHVRVNLSRQSVDVIHMPYYETPEYRREMRLNGY